MNNFKTWVDYYREIAHVVKTKSKDESTQIGCVIVGKGNEIISTGYNSFPRGIEDYHPERQERPEKYFWMEHAERNAIYNAARIGVSTMDSTMYLSCGIPCADCARAIINAGVRKIFCEKEMIVKNKEKWAESAERSLLMFQEAGVHIELYEGTTII